MRRYTIEELERVFSQVRELEGQYPACMQVLESGMTLQEALYVLNGEEEVEADSFNFYGHEEDGVLVWYALFVQIGRHTVECVDVVKRFGAAPFPWVDMLAECKSRGWKKVKADLRHETSYKQIMRFKDCLGVKVKELDEWYHDDGTLMHEVVIRI